MAHATLLNVMWLPDEKAVWRTMDTCRCMAESLHCSPESITMLIIGSTTIQNKKLKKKTKTKYKKLWNYSINPFVVPLMMQNAKPVLSVNPDSNIICNFCGKTLISFK